MTPVFHRSLLLIATVLLASGCQRGLPDVCRVRGKITRSGQPVPFVIVHYFPDQGRPSWGQTDEQGEYELEYDPHRKGAESGHHRIYVEFRARDPDEEHLIRTGKRKFPKEKNDILEKYGESTSALEIVIDKDPQVVDLALD